MRIFDICSNTIFGTAERKLMDHRMLSISAEFVELAVQQLLAEPRMALKAQSRLLLGCYPKRSLGCRRLCLARLGKCQPFQL